MTLEQKKQKYVQLLHAMQTGVAFKMHQDPSETSPKHLRVGVNAAMSDQGALAGLLIAKGLISEEELLDALIKAMEREVKSYSSFFEAQGQHGTKFDLH